MNNSKNHLDSNLVNESSLSRIYQNLNNKDTCMIAISADRDEIDDPKEKEMRQKDLAHDIRLGNFGFVKVQGGYTENKGTPKEKDVIELSYLVTFKKDRFEEALPYFIKLAKKYNQDEILVVKDGESSYINKQGKTTLKLGEWKLRQVDSYFTKLKNGRKFSFDVANVTESKITLYPSERRHQVYVLKSLKEHYYDFIEDADEYTSNLKARYEYINRR